MKKWFSFLFLTLITSNFVFANDGAISFDEKEINSEFKELNKIEAYVNAHEGTTAEELKTDHPDLVTNLELSTNTATLATGDLPGNIPAFWWGCILSIVGVLVVYLVTNEDNYQTKKALVGCLVSAVFWIVYKVLF